MSRPVAPSPLIVINGRFLAVRAATGVQRYSREMVQALLDIDSPYRWLIVAPHAASAGGLPGVRRDGVPLSGYLWELTRLPWLAREAGAALLWSPANTAPLVTGGLPQVVTIADAAVFAQPVWFTPAFRTFYRLLLPRLGRLARKIVTPSHFSRSELLKYRVVTREQDIVVVPCGLTAFSDPGPDVLQELGLAAGTPFVLALGPGDPRKNLARLLAVWADLPAGVKQGRRLVVVGRRGGLSPGNTCPSVVWLDYVSDTHLAALYAHAEVLVYPSLYEGFGLPPLEALAAGTPVLASRAAALTEVLGDAALFCDPYSEEDMQAQLTRLLTDAALRDDLRRRGRERVGRFSWENAARQLLRVFQEVLGR
jgi:glycosyltransferase involved in cell wall biosynthesis